ncbi:hypothetical protein ABEO92_14640 [Geobacillus stearothermophilus]|uniref:hypothetical protein n=1 Tax=Geobacillus stearothermophilus TaxID=1422 RepID=UPI003D1C168C
MGDEKSIVFLFRCCRRKQSLLYHVDVVYATVFFGRLAIYFKKQCEMRYSQAEKPAEIRFLFRR